MASKNFSLPYIYSGRRGDGTFNESKCRATTRSDSWYSYQCERPAKIEFTQADYDSIHPNNSAGTMTAQAFQRLNYGGLAAQDKFLERIGMSFCGTHSPMAILAKQVKALEEEKIESDAYVAKRNSVETRLDAINARLSDMNIAKVRSHRGWANELSTTTGEVDFAIIEKLLATIDELRK